MLGGLSMLWALAGFSVAPAGADVMFARDSAVPRSVQEFVWHVVERRCNYQRYERAQRSFWAYRTRTHKIDGGVIYTIDVVSDATARRREPPAFIEMTVVDDGRVRLRALRSSFIECAP